MLESVASASSSSRMLADLQVAAGVEREVLGVVGYGVLDHRQRAVLGVGVGDRDVLAIDQGDGDRRIADVEVAVGADQHRGVDRAADHDVGQRPAGRNADLLDRVTARQQAREGLGVGERGVGVVVQQEVGRLQVGAGVEREVLSVVGDGVLDDRKRAELGVGVGDRDVLAIDQATVTGESPTSKSVSAPIRTIESTAPVTTMLVSDQPAGMLISWTV